MSDNNRLEIDIHATDNTGPATNQAKANFRSMEQDAARSAAGMSNNFDRQGVEFARSVDRASASAMRSLERLEARAAGAGRGVIGRYTAQRDSMIQNLAGDEAAIKRAADAWDKIISARQRYEEQRRKADSEGGHGGHGNALRRTVLGVKDFLEGRTQGTVIEAADILVGTSGGGGMLPTAIAGIAEVAGVSTIAIGSVLGLAAAFAGLELGSMHAARSLAEQGKEIKEFSSLTGISTSQAQAFQFAAKAEGQKPEIFQVMTRELSQAATDSPEGKRTRQELQTLGVTLRDQFGDIKPTEQILLELADGLDKLPPGMERGSAAAVIFKERYSEVLPVLEHLRENLSAADGLGGIFTNADLQRAEEMQRKFALMDEQWGRLKIHIEEALAPIAIKTMDLTEKAIDAFKRGDFGSNPAPTRPNYTAGGPGRGVYIGPPTAEYAEKLLRQQDRQEAAARMAAFDKTHGNSDALEEAKQQLEAASKDRGQGVKQEGAYEAAYTRYHQLADAEKHQTNGMQDVVTARKERLQLEAQYAEIQQSAQQKQITASLNKSTELTSPEDIGKLLQAARARVDAEQARVLNDHRYKVDEKTGQIQDLSNTAGYKQFAEAEAQNLPLRLRNEYAKVLGDISESDARYFKSRTDADFKAFEDAGRKKLEAQKSLMSEITSLEGELRNQYYSQQSSSIDRQKDLALQQLGLADAQTPEQKKALEDQKFAVESYYAEQSLALQVQKLNSERSLALGKIDREANAGGLTADDSTVLEAKRNANLLYDDQIDAARSALNDKELIDAQRTANEKAKITIESTKSVYQNLKEEANGLFDALFTKTKSWADFGKELFKTAILTPAKDIFSSQIAALFTQGLTGQKVSFGELGDGQGIAGKAGGILGRLGMGPVKIGDQNGLLKLNAPNHLGDVSLVSGAVPVVMMNAQPSNSQITINAQPGRPFLDSLFAGSSRSLSGSTVPVTGSPIESVSSRLITDFGSDYGPADVSSLPLNAVTQAPNYQLPNLDTVQSGGGAGGFFQSLFGGGQGSPVPAGAGSFGFLSSIGLGPGGTSGFAGPVTGSKGGSKGILGNIGGLGNLSGLKSMFGLDTTGTDMGNGVGIARQGFKGNLAAISKSDGFAMLGGIAAMDGIRRGGVAGTIEAAGGGAMVGFKYGGPMGAVVGAAIGGVAALVRTFLGDDRGHTKDLVKQIYGMSINNATADQIIQIAKQSYGGQISVAVRSPEVRNLLRLYAQTLQPDKQGQFVADQVHSASLVESGGKLYQGAVYDNGSAYSYSSPLSVYGGVQTSPLPTYAPNQGVFSGNLQINLNGQSASDALAGQVVKVATPSFVQGQSLAASSASNGRTSQRNMSLSPSALTS